MISALTAGCLLLLYIPGMRADEDGIDSTICCSVAMATVRLEIGQNHGKGTARRYNPSVHVGWSGNGHCEKQSGYPG